MTEEIPTRFDRRGSRPEGFLLALLCAASLALVFLPAFHPVLSPDSLHYAGIAQNLARGEGLASPHLHLGSRAVPDPFLYWPPLYPVLLAGGLKAGLSMEGAFRGVLFFSLLLFGGGLYLLGRRWGGAAMGAAFLAGALLLWPFQKFWRHGWAEVPFTAFSALLLAAAAWGGEGEGRASWRGFAAAGAAAGAGFLCRYLGAAALAPVGAGLFLFARRRGLSLLSRPVLGRALLFLGLFAAFALPWLLRNLSLGGLLGPPRPAAREGAFLLQAGSLFKSLLRLSLLPAAAGLLVFLLGGTVGEGRGPERKRWLLLPVLAFLAGYGGLLLFLGGTIRFDRIRSRLAGPMSAGILPLALRAGAAWDRGGLGRVRLGGRKRFLFLLLLGVLWAGALAVRGFPEKIDKRRLPPSLAAWIRSRTTRADLLVAPRGWWVPCQADRFVLESGYPEQEPLTRAGVARFLKRFPRRFRNVYLLVQEDLPEARELEREYGLEGPGKAPLFRRGRWRLHRLPRGK